MRCKALRTVACCWLLYSGSQGRVLPSLHRRQWEHAKHAALHHFTPSHPSYNVAAQGEVLRSSKMHSL